jgi:hypothetical protein
MLRYGELMTNNAYTIAAGDVIPGIQLATRDGGPFDRVVRVRRDNDGRVFVALADSPRRFVRLPRTAWTRI